MPAACYTGRDIPPLLPKGVAMTTPRFIDELGAKLSELAAHSPAKDIEKNVKALLGSAFGKLDLVTREEFDVQREVLVHARQKLFELEERVAALEAELVRARTEREGE
jgi:BMFP domain-containing protein YqiC